MRCTAQPGFSMLVLGPSGGSGDPDAAAAAAGSVGLGEVFLLPGEVPWLPLPEESLLTAFCHCVLTR